MEINSAVAFLNAIVVQPSLQSSFKTFLSLQHISIKDTCTPVADSRDCMAKTTTILKIISLQLKLKKKRKEKALNP